MCVCDNRGCCACSLPGLAQSTATWGPTPATTPRPHSSCEVARLTQRQPSEEGRGRSPQLKMSARLVSKPLEHSGLLVLGRPLTQGPVWPEGLRTCREQALGSQHGQVQVGWGLLGTRRGEPAPGVTGPMGKEGHQVPRRLLLGPLIKHIPVSH